MNKGFPLDQLQAFFGGATAIEYGLIAAAVPQENSGEAKVESKMSGGFKSLRTRLLLRSLLDR